MKEITPSMIADILWVHSCLKNMGEGFSKPLTTEMLGRTIEFAKGAAWQREKDLKAHMESLNRLNSVISGLKLKIDQLNREMDMDLDA